MENKITYEDIRDIQDQELRNQVLEKFYYEVLVVFFLPQNNWILMKELEILWILMMKHIILP